MLISNPISQSARFSKLYRPAPIALYNIAGRTLGKVGLRKHSIDAARLMRSAQKKSGLSAFGDESFVEPFEVMVESINVDANLSPIGLTIVHGRLLGILINKLRTEAALKANPQILDRPINAPIVIVGLARTGTSMLHRLIAQDTKIRALAAWESMNPAPKEKTSAARTTRASQLPSALRKG